MSKILVKATSPEAFNQAWRHFGTDRAYWAPGVPRHRLERNLPFHLLQLTDDLRSGAYRPDPVRFFPVHKGDGSRRIISANSLRDKVAQRAVAGVLQPILEKMFHDDSFGYRPGRGVGSALYRVREYLNCGLEWLVDADISRFLDHASYYTPFHERLSKSFIWLSKTLIYKPILLPRRTCMEESSPRFTRCNTV